MKEFGGPEPPGVRLDLVLPCLDEAGALPEVLADLPPGFRAIVVDNGSRDGSPAIARALGAVVIHENRRGYGAAVHAGLLAAEAEYVAVMDCDGSNAGPRHRATTGPSGRRPRRPGVRPAPTGCPRRLATACAMGEPGAGQADLGGRGHQAG